MKENRRPNPNYHPRSTLECVVDMTFPWLLFVGVLLLGYRILPAFMG